MRTPLLGLQVMNKYLHPMEERILSSATTTLKAGSTRLTQALLARERLSPEAAASPPLCGDQTIDKGHGV